VGCDSGTYRRLPAVALAVAPKEFEPLYFMPEYLASILRHMCVVPLEVLSTGLVVALVLFPVPSPLPRECGDSGAKSSFLYLYGRGCLPQLGPYPRGAQTPIGLYNEPY
jgi:hypothetical protein